MGIGQRPKKCREVSAINSGEPQGTQAAIQGRWNSTSALFYAPGELFAKQKEDRMNAWRTARALTRETKHPIWGELLSESSPAN